jgi:hypothetical protein
LLLIQLIGYALLVPFFGWGIYLLRRRYLYYEESTMALELATSVFVGVFFWVEILALRQVLVGQFLLHLAAMLGLSMAGFALYAHVLISLVSRVLVDMVTPGDDIALYEPRYGPVDALERNGDYEAALDEYLVLARIYSHNVGVLSRVGRVQRILGHTEEAAAWYLRARKRSKQADDALEAVNHLCELYDQELDTPEKADYQLARFVRDFPDSLDIDIVRDRLNRRANKTDWTISEFLGSLDDEPLLADNQSSSPDELPSIGRSLRSQPATELVALETAGASEEAPVEPDTSQERHPSIDKKKSSATTLAPLSETAVEASLETSERPRAKANNGATARNVPELEAMEQANPTKKTEKNAPAPKPSGISLEPMEDKPTS